jgi:hypothetical protein
MPSNWHHATFCTINLFVSKYRLQLPSEDDIKQYLLENISEEKFKELKEEDSKL